MLENLLREFGGERTRLVWRLLGLAILAIGVLILGQGDAPSGEGWEAALMAAAGLALVCLGGRVLLLALCAAVIAMILARILAGQLAYQLAEEYLPLLVLTGVGAASACWSTVRRAGDASLGVEVESAHLALMRLVALLTMGFAVFHKLNTDFLDPTTSCATAHAQHLLTRMPGGDALALVVPVLALAGEALVPILLLFAPRLGVPFSIGLMGYVGHRGATPFTMLVMALAFAFLSEADTRAIVEAIRLRWRLGVGLVLAVLAASLPFHSGLADWARYGLFEVAFVGLGFALAAGLLPLAWAALGRSPAELRRWLATPVWRSESCLPVERVARAVLALILVAGLLNGITPYLGLKFRLSFAMFSNLRVDDARWNSLLVPRSVSLGPDSAYLHVLPEGVPGGGDSPLRMGLYSPRALGFALDRLRRQGASVALVVRTSAEERSFRDAARSSALHQWLSGLPSSPLFHDFLIVGGAQPCIH